MLVNISTRDDMKTNKNNSGSIKALSLGVKTPSGMVRSFYYPFF